MIDERVSDLDPLAELETALEAAEAWGKAVPPAHEAIALLPRYEAARRALAEEAAQGDTDQRRALEGAVLRARLVLGRARSARVWPALSGALGNLFVDLVPVRFFVALALLVALAAGLVGYGALEADSRLGDLLLAGPAGTGPISLADPLGGLLVLVAGPTRAGFFLGAATRLLLLYGLWIGGFLAGLPPLLALVTLGLRWGLVLSLPETSSAALITVAGGAAPDLLAMTLAAAAGLCVAHRILAPGRLSRAESLAGGLRGGAVLWILALVAHSLAAVPLPSARLLGVAAILVVVLVGGRATCASS